MKHDGPVFASGDMRCGRLRVRQSDVFASQLRNLRDGVVEIRVERKKATRSHQANRFYWGVIIAELSAHTGYTPDEMHDICKAKFLPKSLAIANGNGEIVDELVIGGSTTKLDPIAFSDYIAAIVSWAEELGMTFPALEQSA